MSAEELDVDRWMRRQFEGVARQHYNAGLLARYRKIEARRAKRIVEAEWDHVGRMLLVRGALAAWGDYQAALDGA